jgi:transmembrane sensor
MEENYKLAKWLNDEMSEEELMDFQSEADYHLYQKIKLHSSELATADFKEDEVLTKILATKKPQPKVIAMQPNWFLRIAAVLVIGFGLYFGYNNFSTTTELADNAKQTTFSLPDNSEVVLNSGSEVAYKKWNWDSNRNLELKGEAYFKVAKGKKFQVETDLGTVSVLGTQFNVKARNNRFDITCFEGRVKVNYKNKEVIVTGGQTVAFENDVQILAQNTSDTKPLWTSKEIGFEKEKIANIISELERTYAITIDAKNVLTEQLFTGKLPANNCDVALQIIASTYHLKITKTTPTSYSLEETN